MWLESLTWFYHCPSSPLLPQPVKMAFSFSVNCKCISFISKCTSVTCSIFWYPLCHSETDSHVCVNIMLAQQCCAKKAKETFQYRIILWIWKDTSAIHNSLNLKRYISHSYQQQHTAGLPAGQWLQFSDLFMNCSLELPLPIFLCVHKCDALMNMKSQFQTDET